MGAIHPTLEMPEMQKEEINWKESMIAMRDNSGQKSIISTVSIVPQNLRKGNENIYVPKELSIGPRFKGTTKDIRDKDEIMKWEHVKYLLDLVGGKKERNLRKWGELVLGLEREVRSSYVDELKPMKWRDLTNIMLYDACFIFVCLLMPDDLSELFMDESVMIRDFMVLDNQIPLLILRKMHNQFSSQLRDFTIEALALKFIGYDVSEEDMKLLSDDDIKNASHFVDLVHLYISKEDPRESDQVSLEINQHIKQVQLNRCATRLRAAGVKLSATTSDNSKFWALDYTITFSSSSGTLDIPSLCIGEDKENDQITEVIWRNLIAWEHHKMSTNQSSNTFRCKCTFAALFFNDLICCESDVQLLKDMGIIELGYRMSKQDVVSFFRSLVKGVDRDKIDFRYHLSGDLNNYYRSPMNRVTELPTRFWHYLTGSPREVVRDLHNYLKQGYNLVAAIITIFSLLQTVYAILSYHYPKKGS